jgi:hypothetical protein
VRLRYIYTSNLIVAATNASDFEMVNPVLGHTSHEEFTR